MLRPTACCRAFQSRTTIFLATRRKRSSPQQKVEGRRRSGWRPSTAARHLDRLLRAEIKYPSVRTATRIRSLEEKTNGLVRIKEDGSGRVRITTAPILEKVGVSPDGEWVIVLSPGAGENLSSAVLAVPTRGGAPRKICVGDCLSGWASDGKFFFVAISGERRS